MRNRILQIRRALPMAAVILSLVGGATVPFTAIAQHSYPANPIALVVPFPPGGTSDTAARQISMVLGRTLKQQVVVHNRQGAGGSIGTASVVNAAPDGYTLLMGLSSISTTPEAERLHGRKPMYEMSQLVPVARISADPLVVVVREDSPIRTLKDLMDDARKRPGKVVYASSGNYGPNHVAIEMLAAAAGVKLLHVPYAGGAGTVTALLGQQVDFTLMGPNVAAPHIKSGKVRALGVYGAVRLNDIPTLKEQGFDVEYYIWSGVFAPAGTPAVVIDTLRDAIRKAASDPQFVGSMQSVEMPPAYMDAPEFRRFVEVDANRLVRAVRRIGKVE